MKIKCSMFTAKRMIRCRSHSTRSESFLIISKKTGKKSLKINDGTSAWNDMNDVEQHERAIGMLTAGMSARDVARHFQPHKSTTEQISANWECRGPTQIDFILTQ